MGSTGIRLCAVWLAILLAGQTAAQVPVAAPDPPPWLPSGPSLGSTDGRKFVIDEEDRPHWRKNLFMRVLSDQKYLFTTWAPLEAHRFAFSLPVVAASAGAVDSNRTHPGVDLRLSQSIENWGKDNALGASHVFTTLGNAGSGLLLVGGAYLISRWTGHTRMARASSLSAEAMINAGIWSTTLKSLTRRARPDSDAAGGQFLVDDPGVSNNSFPSGHSMGAFAIASVFAGEYRDKRWVPWVAYGTAGLIGTSRIALGRHYVTDVVVGAVLGRSLGRMVLSREHGLEGNRKQDRIEPIFEPGDQRYGFSYRYSW